METLTNIGNMTLNVFSTMLMYLILPAIIMSILLGGALKPERLIEGIFSIFETILGTLVKCIFRVISLIFKGVFSAAAKPTKYPPAKPGSGTSKKGPGRSKDGSDPHSKGESEEDEQFWNGY